MTAKDLPEYQRAHQVIADHGIGILITGFAPTLAPGQTIEDAYEEENRTTLDAMTPAIRESLRALARKSEVLTKGRGSIKIAEVQLLGASSPGLSYR